MKILIAGDYCPIGRTKKFLEKENYQNLFNGYEKLIKEVDYALINFECPFTTNKSPIVKSGPNLKTDNPNSLIALKYAGFNMLTLANNHIQDYGSKGVIDTIKKAKKLNFDVIGAGKNKEEARKPFIKEIKGTKIGIINICENEFCAATEDIAGAYTFDFIDNLNLINEVKPLVDKLILIYHGGREHYQLPTPEQRKRFRFFIENGVDSIIAHHTHCYSGFEYYQNKPIVYSLGNFLFDYKTKYQTGKWTEGMSVILKLNNKNEDFKIKLIPHYQGRKKNSTITLLNGKEKELFFKKIEKLNEIIADDNLFFQTWENYLKTQEHYYLSSLYVKNFFLRAFFLKKLFPPSLLKFRHNTLLLNLLRCESHQEISKNILEKNYYSKNAKFL